MKYCMKCGAQLFDEAVVCVKCGSLVANVAPAFSRQQPAAPTNQMPVMQPKKVPAEQKKKGPSAFLLASDFVYKISVCLAMFFSILCVGFGKVKTELVTSSKSTIGFRASSVYMTHSGFAVFAVMFAVIALVFGIASCIATLVGSYKAERVLSGISKLIVGVLLLFGVLALLGNS